jgi:integrase
MELFKRRNSDTWQCWAHFFDGTERRRKAVSTGVRDDGSAEAKRNAEIVGYQIERRLAAGGPDSARSTKTLRQALRALTEAQELAGRSDANMEIIADKGANLVAFFGAERVMHTVTKELLRDYAVQARRSRSVGTVQRELLVFKQACAAVGVVCPERPDIGEPTPPPQRILDVDEQRRLLLAVAPKRKGHLLSYLQLGVRQSELWKITEIDWEDRYLHVAGTKTKQAKRWVPIPEELFEWMESQRRAWVGFERWTMIDRDLRLAAERAELGRDLSCNDLRGTYAHHMAIAGTPQLLLAKWMGTSVKMLDQVYARLDKRGDYQHEYVARGVPRLRREA